MVSFAPANPDGSLTVDIDSSVYSIPALLRTCYWYTDRAYILITRAEPGLYKVHFSAKIDSASLASIVGDFANSLLDNQLRTELSAETQGVREQIVAKAFSEGNLMDDNRDPEQSTLQDPVTAAKDWNAMVSERVPS